MLCTAGLGGTLSRDTRPKTQSTSPPLAGGNAGTSRGFWVINHGCKGQARGERCQSLRFGKHPRPGGRGQVPGKSRLRLPLRFTTPALSDIPNSREDGGRPPRVCIDVMTDVKAASDLVRWKNPLPVLPQPRAGTGTRFVPSVRRRAQASPSHSSGAGFPQRVPRPVPTPSASHPARRPPLPPLGRVCPAAALVLPIPAALAGRSPLPLCAQEPTNVWLLTPQPLALCHLTGHIRPPPRFLLRWEARLQTREDTPQSRGASPTSLPVSLPPGARVHGELPAASFPAQGPLSRSPRCGGAGGVPCCTSVLRSGTASQRPRASGVLTGFTEPELFRRTPLCLAQSLAP